MGLRADLATTADTPPTLGAINRFERRPARQQRPLFPYLLIAVALSIKRPDCRSRAKLMIPKIGLYWVLIDANQRVPFAMRLMAACKSPTSKFLIDWASLKAWGFAH
jgi:hypothetical protein